MKIVVAVSRLQTVPRRGPRRGPPFRQLPVFANKDPKDPNISCGILGIAGWFWGKTHWTSLRGVSGEVWAGTKVSAVASLLKQSSCRCGMTLGLKGVGRQTHPAAAPQDLRRSVLIVTRLSHRLQVSKQMGFPICKSGRFLFQISSTEFPHKTLGFCLFLIQCSASCAPEQVRPIFWH